MDSIIANLTSTTGRLNRQPFWIGAIILAVVNIVISMLILPLVGFGMPNIMAMTAANSDPAALAAALEGAFKAAGWGSLIVFIIFAYPYYALAVKRRHDRDNNGLDVLIYLVLSAIVLLLQALGLAYTMTDVGGISMPMPSMLFSVAGVILGIYGIYLLVVLGFLKGTAGPNQYGPDPLGGA